MPRAARQCLGCGSLAAVTKLVAALGIGVLVLLIVAVNGCFGCDRELVDRPELDLELRAGQAPLHGGTLHYYRWSQPHSQLDYEESLAIEDGSVAMTPSNSEQTVYPLCMHGVPENHYTYCVQADGYVTIAFELLDPQQATELELELEQGVSVPCTFDDAEHGRLSAERSDHDNVLWLYELASTPNQDEQGQ